MQIGCGAARRANHPLRGLGPLFVLIALALINNGCAGLAGSGSPAPVTVSNPSVINITSTGASVTWTTNVRANSQVKYGTTISYGQITAVDSTMVTNHAVNLSGLTPSTQYHFRVISQDGANNLAMSGDFTFTTATSGSPTISGITANPGSTSSFITWVTDRSADSQVEYGLSASYGQSSTLDSTQATSHSVTLTGLTATTLYHYRVKSRDGSGNLGVSADQTFTTTASGSPTISGITASPNSTTSFITWGTDKPADSQVEYGLSTSYGQSSTLDSTQVTSHSLTLTGLTATTLYHYRVKSRDASGNLGVSADQTFTTTALGDGTQIPPNVWVLLPDQPADSSAVVDKGNCGGTPCTRAWFPMVYDSDAKKVLVLGGGVYGGCLSVGGGYINDVWEYDFSRNTWKQRLPVDANRNWPPGADNVSAAYDPVQKRTWMQAGTCDFHFGYYDYAINRSTSLSRLPGEHGLASNGDQDPIVAFDTDDNKLLVFGGDPGWQYDPGEKTDQFDPLTNQWTDRAPLTGPSGRQQIEYAGVYSAATKKLIVFGGETNSGPPFELDDTWEYDYRTNTWSKPPQANAPNPHPPASSRHAVVYDSTHNVVIAIPLFNSSTWIYNPVSHTWSVLSGTNAPNGKLMGIAFDSVNGVVILFGGADNNGVVFQGVRAFRYQPAG
jgi:hypothetical protein